MTQGQSVATIDKERRIGSALTVGTRIASSKLGGRGYKYWHFDANAGSGWNEKVNVPGSPLVAWEVFRASLDGLQPEPFFCDIDPNRIEELCVRLGQDLGRSRVFIGDNEEVLEVFAECIRRADKPQYAIGSILVDPDGWFYRSREGIGVPFKGLYRFCAEFPRIDVVLNLNLRIYNALKGKGIDVMSPTEVLDSLKKAHWLVAQAYVAQSRFLLAVGRNVRTGDHSKVQLFHRDSDIGQSILSRAEGGRQHELF